MNINIGCSGWFYLHWYKTFYPEGIKRSQWFKYYSSLFNTVEINSTFYTMPSEKRSITWYKNSPEHFIYAVKMNKTVTHINKLNNCSDIINDFINKINPLNGKLKCILYQMPPSFKKNDENMKMVFNIPRGSFIEFRHRSWDAKSMKDIIESGIHVVSVSSSKFPFIVNDDDILYLRFHGDKNGYMTDYNDRLRYFAEKIIESGANTSYIYFNNGYNAYAPKNALKLIEIINELI